MKADEYPGTKLVHPKSLKPGQILMVHTIPHSAYLAERTIQFTRREPCVFCREYKWRVGTAPDPARPDRLEYFFFFEANPAYPEFLPLQMARIKIQPTKK